MSTLTIASLPRITSSTLSALLLANQSSNVDESTPPASLAIIDVRDDGISPFSQTLHASTHFTEIRANLTILVDYIGGHIKHSTHVPSSTLAHKIPELVRKLKDKETVIFHCALSQMRGPGAALRYLRERERLLGPAQKEEQAAAVKDEAGAETETPEVKEQKVYVLDDGFVGWVQKYGEDVRLTEGYRKELWKDGYSY
jgi:Cdc25 family phosphatase